MADNVIPSASEKSIYLPDYIVKTLLGNLSTEYETYSLEKYLLQKELTQESGKTALEKLSAFLVGLEVLSLNFRKMSIC